jgi:hypothetical protein
MAANKAANGLAQTTRSDKLQTEFEFVLPRGYVDSQGTVHRKGNMRLATALDEIAPLRDPRVRANQAYITIIILSRVVTKLGALPDVNPGVIESLFTMDMAYLQDFYRRINNIGHAYANTICPECNAEIEIDLGNHLTRSKGGAGSVGE